MANFKVVNNMDLNGRDIINIPGADANYDSLTEIAVKVAELATVAPIYKEDISGTASLSAIAKATHNQGDFPVVQIYDHEGKLVHGADVTNTAGEIEWSAETALQTGSYILIRG